MASRTVWMLSVVYVGTATKECLLNGTWYKRDGLPWTDYTRCLDKHVRYYQNYPCGFHIRVLYLS